MVYFQFVKTQLDDRSLAATAAAYLLAPFFMFNSISWHTHTHTAQSGEGVKKTKGGFELSFCQQEKNVRCDTNNTKKKKKNIL